MKVTNQLLKSLPAPEFNRIEDHLEEIKLESGTIIYQIHELIRFVYFPNDAMISLVSIMEDGSTTEIGLVGNEGMVGLPVFLGGKYAISDAITQITGKCLRLKANILKQEFQRGESLHRLLLLYTQARLVQVAQSAACNRQHNIDQRLARWLLSVHDCVLKDELPLTQEFIGNMLGIRRSGVTIAANRLQEAGIISYSRGKITILNYDKLEEMSCECYRLVQSEYIRLLGFRRG